MKKSRLLVVADVSPIESRGGSVRLIREQCRRLRERGHDLLVLARSPGDDAPTETEVDGFPVRHYHVNRTNPLAFFFSSIAGARRAGGRLLGDSSWDAVIFHQPFSAFGLSPVLARWGVPCAYFFHSPAGVEYRLRARKKHPRATVLFALPLLRWVERRALRRSSVIVVLSDFSRRELFDQHGEIPREIVKISGGVDLDRFHPAGDRKALRERLGLPSDRLLFLTVRDLEYRMGIDNLILAMRRVRNELRALLVIGGTGELSEELAGMVERLDLASTVRFAGHIPDADLPAYYQVADLFVLPTRALEGFGLVTAEALASGTPVLGTPVGATPELLMPLDPGLVTEDASADALASGLVRVAPRLGDQALRERCREYAEANFNWERVVDDLEGALSRMVRTP